MQLLQLVLHWMMLWALIEAQSKTTPKKNIITVENFPRLDRKITRRLVKIQKKYKDKINLEDNAEFERMFERVEDAVDLDEYELDKKIDVLTEFEIWDGLRMELDRRINVTIATIDEMLNNHETECEGRFKEMKESLSEAIDEANKVKSKKLRTARLTCNKKAKITKGPFLSEAVDSEDDLIFGD